MSTNESDKPSPEVEETAPKHPSAPPEGEIIPEEIAEALADSIKGSRDERDLYDRVTSTKEAIEKARVPIDLFSTGEQEQVSVDDGGNYCVEGGQDEQWEPALTNRPLQFGDLAHMPRKKDEK